MGSKSCKSINNPGLTALLPHFVLRVKGNTFRPYVPLIDRQYTYNATLRRDCVIIVAVVKQYVLQIQSVCV